MPNVADSVVQFGLSQIGYTYKTGAQLAHDAYQASGIDIPRTAVGQAYRAGQEIIAPKRGNLAPGDLVFPTLRVVQIYVGGGYCLTVMKSGVIRRPVRRVWRAVRITTPGGGAGLSLAKPGNSPQKMVPRGRF